MLRALYIIVFILFSSSYYSINLDSLNLVISKMPDDTNKVQKLISLSYTLLDLESDSSLNIAFKANDVALKVNNKIFVSKTYNLLGHCFRRIDDYDSAIHYFEKEFNLSCEIGYRKGINYSLGNITNAYISQSNYPKGIEYCKKAMDTFNQSNDSLSIALIKMVLTRIYVMQQNFEEAKKLANESLECFIQKGDTNNMTAILQYLSIISRYQNDFQQSYNYAKQSLTIAEEKKDSSKLFALYETLANTCVKLNKNTEAEQYFDKSIAHYRKKKKHKNLSNVHMAYAIFQMENKQNYKLAKQHLDSSQKYTLDETPLFLSSFNKLYSQLYESEQNYKKALDHHKLFKLHDDSLYRDINDAEILKLQTQFETKEKESKIAIQAKDLEVQKAQLLQEKQLRYFIIGTIILLALVGWYLFWRNKKQQQLKFENQQVKSKNDLLELEQKLLLSQMNPHFIFNSLNSIKQFVLQNKSADANQYLSDFAQLMRLILESSRKELISLEDELNILNHYLKLEQIRSNNQFQYQINVDENIEEEAYSLQIPPMILQPIVENAIKHGVSNIRQGFIQISIQEKNEDLLSIKVQDNGPGINSSLQNKSSSHQSLGLQITQERIQNFEQKHHKTIHIKTIDLQEQNQNGTMVELTMPLIAA